MLFSEYYKNWIETYKRGAVRDVTLQKYMMTLNWIKRISPCLEVGDLDRLEYQRILNEYAKKHEKQTVMDFSHMLKSAILDAVDDGLIPRDPTRRAVVKGKPPREKKIKYLNQFQMQKLLSTLDLEHGINADWMILLVAKTGLRFSEAVGLTPEDFDFNRQIIDINKTWDYKAGGGFVPTKNSSSVRKVQIDWKLATQFSGLLKDMPEKKPVFVKEGETIYNSTINGVLARHCKEAEVPVISMHGLRHTHASLLLFAGVSIASVSQRLGHSNMSTTQKVYLHIIKEMENKEVDLVMRQMSALG